MHLISHLTRPTAAFGACVCVDLLPSGPTGKAQAPRRTLAVAHTGAVVLLALPDLHHDTAAAADVNDGAPPPLRELARLELPARVVAMRCLPAPVTPSSGGEEDGAGKEGGRGTRETARLALLTDHHAPRLVVLRAVAVNGSSTSPTAGAAPSATSGTAVAGAGTAGGAAGPAGAGPAAPHAYAFETEASLALDERALPPAELGMGLALDAALGSAGYGADAGRGGAGSGGGGAGSGREGVGEGAARAPTLLVAHTHAASLRVVPLAQPAALPSSADTASAVADGADKASTSAKGKGKARAPSLPAAAGSGAKASVKAAHTYDPESRELALTRGAFSVRLPHATLIASTFLDAPTSASSGGPILALLSLSSSPSRVAGLGPQCLPVLSFHRIDADAQALAHVPWAHGAAPRKVLGPLHPPAAAAPPSSAGAAAAGSSAAGAGASSAGAGSAKPKAKYGPSASGRAVDTAAQASEERATARSALALAHVPLPVQDALGAHHLLALPRAWGGGALLFCEGAVMYVPPPAATAAQSDGQHEPATPRRKSSAASASASAAPPLSPSAARSASGSAVGSAPIAVGGAGAADASKRRKGSASASGAGSGAGAGAGPGAAGFSPDSTENENGKRAGAAAASGSALSTSPETTRAGAPASPSARRASGSASTSADAGAPPRRQSSSGGSASASGARMAVLKAALKMPVKVVAAAVMGDSYAPVPNASGSGTASASGSGSGTGSGTAGATAQVVYCTHAGAIDAVTLHFAATPANTTAGEPRQPARLSVQHVGHASRPGGPDGLTYLGEGFVHIASSSGDSMLVRIAEAHAQQQQGEDAEMLPPPVVSPPASPTALRGGSAGAAAPKMALSEVHRWPQLGPILDFVVDDGAGGDVSAGNAVQARIITASGTDATGSLRVIRSGVSVDVLAELELEADATGLWTVDGAEPGGKAFLIDTAAGRRLWLLHGAAELHDLSQALARAGVNPADATLAVLGLRSGTFAIVTAGGAYIVQLTLLGAEPAAVVASHTPADDATFTAAAAAQDGTVLIATSKAQLQLLRIADSAFEAVAMAQAPSAVSCVHVNGSLAAVGLWGSNAVALYQLPSLQAVTPASIEAAPHASLPRSVLLHHFSSRLPDAPIHLFVGLGDGSIAIYTLALPRPGAISQAIRVVERKEASLGTQRAALSPITVAAPGAPETAAVFVACDRPTIIAADPERSASLTYSAVQAKDVVAAAQLTTATSGEATTVALLSGAGRVQIAQLGQVQKLDVTRIELGHDDPLALARHPQQACIAAVTWRFLPYGRRTKIDTVRGSVKIFDQTDVTLLDTALLKDNERPNCVEVMQLGSAQETFVIVGTGIVDESRSETLSGRVLGFRVINSAGSRSLQLAFAGRAQGNVYAVAPAGSFLAAAINSEVVAYQYNPDADADGPRREGEPPLLLQQVDTWGCAFVACTLSNPTPGSNKLVVGDAMRSLSVLRCESNGRLVEVAKDCDPYWTTAAEQLDDVKQQYIGADISFNIFISERQQLAPAAKKKRAEREAERETRATTAQLARDAQTDPADAQEDANFSHVMRRAGVWHYGDLINKFRKETLVPKSAWPAEATPQMLFVTAGGAVGLVSRIESDEAASVLSQVERNMDVVVPPLGDISHEDWRTMRTEHRVAPPAGFLDGDMLQRFQTHLTPAQREEVIQGGSDNVTMTGDDDEARAAMAIEGASVAQVTRLIESLGRLV